MAKDKQEKINPKVESIEIEPENNAGNRIKVMTFEEVILNELQVMNAQINELRMMIHTGYKMHTTQGNE